MNAFLTAFPEAVLRPVAWALVHFLWQGALVALVVAAVLAALSGKSARLRYLTACAGLAAMVILPVVTAAQLGADASGSGVSGATLPASAVSVESSTPQPTPGAVSSRPNLDLRWLRERLEPHLPGLFAVWLAGVVALSLAHLGGWRRVRRLRRDGRPAPGRWEAAAERLARRLDISRAVDLLESARVRIPVVIGWLRPAILVPASAFAGLSPQQLEAVLAHELAHVRRHDYLVNLFQVTLETLLFYHPGVWWVSRQVRIERENCCDDLAVRVCGSPVAYARALADLEELRFGAPALALGADGGSLVARIRRLVGRHDQGAPSRLAAAGPALVAAFVAALGGVLFSFAFSSNAMPFPGDPAVLGELELAAPAGEFQIAQADPQDDGERRERRWWRMSDDEWLEADVEELRQVIAGTPYERLSADEVEELARKGLDEELIPALVKAGFTGASADELADMARHGVDGEDVYELRQAGFEIESTGELVDLARHGVDGEDVRELRAAGFGDLSTDELIRLARHGVDGEDVRDFHDAGYTDLSIDDLVELARHGVDGEDVREMVQAGYSDLSVDDLVRLARQGVDGEDIRDFHDAGYTDLSVDDLTRLSRYGLDGEDVRDFRDAGYTDLSIDDLVRLSRYGLDGEDVRDFHDAGYTDLSIDDLVRLSRYGLDGEDVRGFHAAGYTDLSVDDLVALSKHGVDGEDVRDFHDAGYTNLSVDNLVDLARYGVDGEDLQELRDAGYTDLSVDEILRLARRGRLDEMMDHDDEDD